MTRWLFENSPAFWAESTRGFRNADFHLEWYRLFRDERRLALIAPREHAKTEVGTVNMTVWRSIHQEGIWTYVFAATTELAEELKARIDAAMTEVRPDLVSSASRMSKRTSLYGNGSRITVAGVGKAVRSAHPDVIIGDDVLSEETTRTSYQRRKMRAWWFGAVAGMAHPGTQRIVKGRRRTFPPTVIQLVGTPFHKDDLLNGMKSNAAYTYRRYAAEFQPEDLVQGLAVDAN